MKKLNSYAVYSHHGEHGLKGDCFELAIKDLFGYPLKVSGKGAVDVRIKINGVKTTNKVEVKTGAGEIPNNLKGNSYVVYCPVVDLNKPLNEQEGFVIKRTDFIEVLKASGCYRACKKTSSGEFTHAIQTFWNNKRNEPHGKKYECLLDNLYNSG